jgi:WD40 repeat protein
VSPDGSKVFVTGKSAGSTTGDDYATQAYNPGTGAVVWTQRYNGPANAPDSAYAVAVSPDGSKMFVTGESAGTSTGYDYATVAYDAGTGAVVWTNRYNGPANNDDHAWAMAVGPHGGRLVVTGTSNGSTTGPDYATVAYNAGTGAVAWTTRYNGGANGADNAAAVAVSPDSSKVFVTGDSAGVSPNYSDYRTLAYGL